MKRSALATERRSPLMEAMSVKNGNTSKGHREMKDLAIALPLTSLIDAFSIIVIYLLIGTQSSGIETQINGQLHLPSAEHAQSVEKTMAILRIEKGQYFLDDQLVAKANLSERLTQLKKSAPETVELMVQADTNMEYADLDPLLRAGSEAGIEKLRFAVMPNQ